MRKPIVFSDLIVPAYFNTRRLFPAKIEHTRGKRTPQILLELAIAEGMEEVIRAARRDCVDVMLRGQFFEDTPEFMRGMFNNVAEDWLVGMYLCKNKPHTLVDPHIHFHTAQTLLVVRGEILKLVTAFGEKLESREEMSWLGPGTVIVMPKNVAHGYYMEPGTITLCYSNRALDPKNPDTTLVNLS